MPWLIGGPQGIGKATLAYRMALVAREFQAPASVQRVGTLARSGCPVARQITAGAHGGLLVLERGLSDRGVMRT
jgi:DNA polymerase-3 subunit delta'